MELGELAKLMEKEQLVLKVVISGKGFKATLESTGYSGSLGTRSESVTCRHLSIAGAIEGAIELWLETSNG